MNQDEFSKRIGIARSLVSACEGKGREPSTYMYVRLGNFAVSLKLYSLAAWFWKQAGVEAESMLSLAAQDRDQMAVPPRSGQTARVRPSKSGLQADRPAKSPTYLALPAQTVPNAPSTSYLRVEDDAMLPMFKRGDILVIDSSETDLWKLQGSWVAIRGNPSGPSAREKAIIEREKNSLPRLMGDIYADSLTFKTAAVLAGVLLREVEAGASMLQLHRLARSSEGPFDKFEILAFEQGSARNRRRSQYPGLTVLGRVVWCHSSWPEETRVTKKKK
jgi:hypothetical protein